jgi:cytochrome-b5 reductase
MKLQYTDAKEGAAVVRSYTPVTSNDDKGHFDLVIKVYPDGKMTQHLKNMEEGESIIATGPTGRLVYEGKGLFKISNRPKKVRNVGMLAGGTGITPMLQIIRHIGKTNDDTKMSLIFANVTEDDILLRNELEQAEKSNGNFSLHYTLDKPNANWGYSSGFITPAMIQEHLPAPADDTLILICGPPPMVKFMCKNLDDLGYSQDMYFTY